MRVEGLVHPNIAPDGDLEGEPLADYLARTGRLPAPQGLALAAQLLSALDHAHGQGRVHGALDPDHILISRTGRVRVLGFDDPSAARTGTRPHASLPDAPACMAPEQVLGWPADRRCDVYAAAVIAYRLLTGAMPFVADNGWSCSQSVLRRASPLPVRSCRPELPEALDPVFRRALAQSPSARYADAPGLLHAVQAALDSSSTQAHQQAHAGSITADAPATDTAPDASPREAVPVMRAPVPASATGQWFELMLSAACLAAVTWAASFLIAVPPVNVNTPAALADAPGPVPHSSPSSVLRVPIDTVMPARGEPVAPAHAPPAAPALTPLLPVPVPPPAPVADQGMQRSPPQATAPMASPPVAVGDIAASSKSATRSGTSRNGAVALAQARRVPSGAASHRGRKPPVRLAGDLNCRQGLAIARGVCEALRCTEVRYMDHPICVRQQVAQQRARDLVAQSHF